MASVSGASSSNITSSLFNSANMISGLASGLDTEGMIESLVQSYQTKINSLNQKVTKTEWKQDAYRSIIEKMVGLNTKYTSYSSTTNLLSPNFFNSAVKVAPQGIYGGRVTASGRSNSDVVLNAVSQLATSAQFRTSSNLKSGDGKSIEAASGVDLKGKTTLGTLSGSLMLTYGSSNVSIQFDEVADVKTLEEIKEKGGARMTDAEALAELINKKLEGQKVTLSGGASVSAKDRIQVQVSGNSITFKDKSTAGNSVYISSASENVTDALGLDLTNASENRPDTIKMGDMKLTKQVDNAEYLSRKSMNLSLDGTSKTIKLPRIAMNYTSGNYEIVDAAGGHLKYTAENYTKVLNETLNDTFKGKVTVENVGEGDELKLRFNVQEGSNLVINSDVGETLGIGRSATSYLNASKTLGDLLDADTLSGLTQAADDNGRPLTDSDGNPKYAFVINGVQVGAYSKNSTLNDIMSDINSNRDAGVKVSYSQVTKNFLFTSKETGEGSEVTMGNGLAQAMFGKEDSRLFSANEKVGNLISAGAKYGDSGDNAVIHAGTWNIPLRIEKEDSINDVVGKLNDIFKDIESQLPGEGQYTARFDTKLGTFVIRDNKTGEDMAATTGEGIAKDLIEATKALAVRSSNSAVDLKSSTKDLLGMGADEQLKGNRFSINVDGKKVAFTFGLEEDSKLEHILSNIENIMGNGTKAYFSGKDGSLVVTDRYGKQLSVTYGDEENNLAEKIVDKVGEQMGYTKGQDAKFNVTVNGETMNMIRSSNSVDIDGLTINFQDTFNGAEDEDGNAAVDTTGKPRNAVTFKSSTDSDKIVDAIKSLIEDYNVMMAEIKSAYSTMPYKNSNGKFANYEPLTDDDRAEMSEAAIERYEAKAKQGILFGDRTLSGLYDKLRNVFSPAGDDGGLLRAMGINVSYSITEGTQAVTLDESKLRAMLDSDPDAVADVFTRSGDGVMQTMKSQLENYARTTGEPKGILIQQAGSPLSSLSLMNNTWQTQIDSINKQIEKWQDKLTSQVEKYTSQFSRLEVLIQQMNSQSSTLAGLMGG